MNKVMTILSRDDQTVLSDRLQANQHFTPATSCGHGACCVDKGLHDSQMPAVSESLVADKRMH